MTNNADIVQFEENPDVTDFYVEILSSEMKLANGRVSTLREILSRVVDRDIDWFRELVELT